MRDECIQSVRAAAAAMGKTLSQSDLRGIEKNINDAARLNRRDNPETFLKQSPGERTAAAAERVARQIVADKAKAAQRIAQQIIAHDRANSFVQNAAKQGMPRMEAMHRALVNFGDSKANFKSFEQEYDGVAGQLKGRLVPLGKATDHLVGYFSDPVAMRALHMEIRGENSGNPQAKAHAKIWNDHVAEPQRRQVNEAGGNIGKLEGGYDPQVWIGRKVAAESTEKFIEDIRPLLKRTMYIDHDGKPMNDIALNAVLGPIRDTLASDGASKPLTGEGFGTSFANRGAEHRVLHFANAEAAQKAMQLYGEPNLMSRMISHVNRGAQQIAAMKTFGPNAGAGLKALLDEAESADIRAGHSADKTGALRREIETGFKIGAGLMEPNGNPAKAVKWQTLRNVQMMMYLGSASIKAMSDVKNIVAVNMAHNLPALRTWGKWGTKAHWDAQFRDFMASQGSALQTFAHGMSRFGEDMSGHGTSAAWANAFFKATWLNKMDTANRMATDAGLMHMMGQLTRKYASLDAVPDADKTQLIGAGISDKTWQTWRAAKLDDKYDVLCPDTIAQIADKDIKHLGNPDQLRRDAMQDLVGYTTKHTNTVVPMMNLRQRAKVEDVTRSLRGSHLGELARTALVFKSFPIADFSNHLQRMASMPTTGSKIMYMSSVYGMSLVLGSAITQMLSMLAGNNPQNMKDPKFYVRSLVNGGGLNLYMEMLASYVGSPYRQHIADQLGPTFSSLEQVAQIGEDLKDATGTKKPNTGGDVVHLLRGHAGNVFWAKAALDHLIFQRLQEYYSPGYQQRMQARMQQYFGSGAYMTPSTAASPREILSGSSRGIRPIQQPNLKTAVGER